MSAPLARALYRLWVTMQDELAALSSDQVHVVAIGSDHWVQIRRFYRGNQRIDGPAARVRQTTRLGRWRTRPMTTRRP